MNDPVTGILVLVIFLICMIIQMILTARGLRTNGLGPLPPEQVDNFIFGFVSMGAGLLWWIIWPSYGIAWLLKK